MTIKTGEGTVTIPPFHKLRVVAETPFSLFTIQSTSSKDIKVEKLFAVSQGNEIIVRTKDQEQNVLVKVAAAIHWSPELTDESPFDKVSSIPFEVPEELKKPESLEEKMKRFLAGMVIERYGIDSQQAETFEESMDFDMDEVSEPFSAYELQDMPEEFPTEPQEAAEATPTDVKPSASEEPPAPKETPEA
jgi:hypothetical protein